MSINLNADFSEKFISALNKELGQGDGCYGLLDGKVIKRVVGRDNELFSARSSEALRSALIATCQTLVDNARIQGADEVMSEVRRHLGLDDGDFRIVDVTDTQISDVIKTLKDRKIFDVSAYEGSNALSITDEFVLLGCLDDETEITNAKAAEREARTDYVDAALGKHVKLQKLDVAQQEKVLKAFDPKGDLKLLSKDFLSCPEVKDVFTRELKNQLAQYFRRNVAFAPKPENISEKSFETLVTRTNQQAAFAVYSALAAVSDFREELVEMMAREQQNGGLDDHGKEVVQSFLDAENQDELVRELLKDRLPPAKMQKRLLEKLDANLKQVYLDHSTAEQRNVSVAFEQVVKKAAQTAIDKMHKLTTKQYLDEKIEKDIQKEKAGLKANAKAGKAPKSLTDKQLKAIAKNAKKDVADTRAQWVKDYGETGLDVLLKIRKNLKNMRSVPQGDKTVDLFSSPIKKDVRDAWVKQATETFKNAFKSYRQKYPNALFYNDFIRISNNKPWLSRVTIDGKNLGTSWDVEPEGGAQNEKLLEEIDKKGGFKPEKQARACLLKLLKTVPSDVKNRSEIVFFLSMLNTLAGPMDVFFGDDKNDFGWGSKEDLINNTWQTRDKNGCAFDASQWYDQTATQYEYRTSEDKLTIVMKGTIGPSFLMGPGSMVTQFNAHLPREKFEATIEIPFEKLAPGEADEKKEPKMKVNMQIKPLVAEEE